MLKKETHKSNRMDVLAYSISDTLTPSTECYIANLAFISYGFILK